MARLLIVTAVIVGWLTLLSWLSSACPVAFWCVVLALLVSFPAQVWAWCKLRKRLDD